MRRTLLSLGAIGIVASAGVLSWSQDPSATRDGRFVFLPWEPLASDELDQGAARVEIRSCQPDDEGFILEGRVTPSPGVLPILVSGNDLDRAGLAVGQGFANAVELIESAQTGDFRVRIPWASPSSRFAAALPDSLGPDEGAVRHGPVARCP